MPKRAVGQDQWSRHACPSRTSTATETATATAMAMAVEARTLLLERTEIDLGGRHPRAQRAVRQLPDRRPQLRQLRRDHGPQRQLLSLPQLRQQHGLLVTDCRATGPAGDPSAWRAPLHMVGSGARCFLTAVVASAAPAGMMPVAVRCHAGDVRDRLRYLRRSDVAQRPCC